MKTIAIESSQATLADLIRQVSKGEEFTITQDGEPKAMLSPVTSKSCLKNGILVHHGAGKISSEDVVNALSEE